MGVSKLSYSLDELREFVRRCRDENDIGLTFEQPSGAVPAQFILFKDFQGNTAFGISLDISNRTRIFTEVGDSHVFFEGIASTDIIYRGWDSVDYQCPLQLSNNLITWNILAVDYARWTVPSGLAYLEVYAPSGLLLNLGLNIALGDANANIARDGSDSLVLTAEAASGSMVVLQGTSAAPKLAVTEAGQIRTTLTSSGSTLGSVAKKLPIYDAAGALLGYIPIYDDIT
jgi:hypothetical protein